MNTYCYKCAKPLTVNTDGYSVCEEHGTLWPLHRNSVCAEAFIVREDGKVLLIKRATEPFIGSWALPGGFSEYGEIPADTAIREALEETGWKVELTGILGVYMDSFSDDPMSEHRVVVSYLARPISDGGEIDDETQGHDWFDPADLPNNVVPVQLNRFADYAKN